MRTLKCLLLSIVMNTVLIPANAWSGNSYPDALPDHRITKGLNDIREAWLSHPTTRYQHFVLGSNYEAGTLNVRLSDGKHIAFTLDENSVFEDRKPRLADLDGDGRDEVIIVRSYLKTGAALSVFGIRDGKLSLIAETPDMGHPFGWLNPAGIDDFDGDGLPEIAFVRKPHVLGQLELWKYQDGRLKLVARDGDASNHAIGSNNLGLSVVADFNGDGVADLAIPSRNRREIRFISFRNGIKELARKKLPGQATSDFLTIVGKGVFLIDIGLQNGKRVTIRP